MVVLVVIACPLFLEITGFDELDGGSEHVAASVCASLVT
jgi:hypothetical protein